jgi:hypothetical protein
MPSDMPLVIVEVAFTVGGPGASALHLDDPVLGLLNTGTLGADTWVEVAPATRLESLHTRQGSTRVESPQVRFDAGIATAVLNDPDRRYDPTNLSGPYVSGGRTQVTPMREVRMRAVWNGTAYPLFRGYADKWEIDWDATTSTVTLPCTDAFKILEGKRRGPQVAVGAGELTSARINRILDGIGWPATDRVIGTGSITVQETTLEGSPLAELQLTADTEIGELYIDGSGRVVFRGRMALLTETRSTISQATFGQAPGIISMPLATDDDQLYNEIKITRVGGVEQVVEDTASQSEFQIIRTFERSDLLMQDDATAADYASWILHLSSQPETRFDKIVLYPRRNPALWPQVLGRQIGDRITCWRQPPTGGDPIQLDAFIRGIEHQVEQADWTTTWVLQSAAKVGSFLTLDHPTAGRLDNNALAF